MRSLTTVKIIRQPRKKAKIPNIPAIRPDPLAIPITADTTLANPKAPTRNNVKILSGGEAITIRRQKMTGKISPTAPAVILPLFLAADFSLIILNLLWPDTNAQRGEKKEDHHHFR